MRRFEVSPQALSPVQLRNTGRETRHRGVFGENKPLHESFRKGGDAHVETLRAHDAAKKEEARRDEVVVEPAREKERERGRYVGTGESKPIHEDFRSVSASHAGPAVPAKDHQGPTGAGVGERRSAHSDDGTAGNGGGKKNGGGGGFMNKVKGEMKVLSGKLTHKEEKVEEGRRRLGKN
ncbi:hypothetical protein NMY22_g19061 [Coprinellus aureogranulatus]|nr:hypothetical protein NMY22_g19061 [Coprinellus aureogranulatus]